MRPQLIDGFLLILTFALGALLSRVSLCAVAAVQQFIIGRDLAGLNRLLLAAGGAGLIVSRIARALPKPEPMGSRLYLFLFNLAQGFLANPDQKV